MDEEIKELYEYFRLSSYRDSEYFLLDEYDELERIIKKNKTAQYLEKIRYQYLKNAISEEEYDDICNDCLNKLILKK